MRVETANYLAKGRLTDATLTTLLDGLDVKSEVLRDAILAALVKLKATPALVKLALDEKAMLEKRVLALNGLRTVKPKESAAELIPLLKSPEPKLRESVAHVFCVFGAEKAQDALVAALNDDDSKVRYFAVVALGSLKSESVTARLIAMKRTEKDLVVQDALIQATRP
jgi:HEAT repeat protein